MLAFSLHPSPILFWKTIQLLDNFTVRSLSHPTTSATAEHTTMQRGVEALPVSSPCVPRARQETSTCSQVPQKSWAHPGGKAHPWAPGMLVSEQVPGLGTHVTTSPHTCASKTRALSFRL